MYFHWLHALSYFLLLSWTATAEQFYVVPSGSTSCPRKPCYTLTDIVLNSSRYFASNTVITFLPGNHTTNISKDLSVLIKNVTNISMIGCDHTNTDSKSVIQCTGSLGFTFKKVTTLKIARLSFTSCEAKIHPDFKIRNFPEQALRMTFFFLQTINVAISEVNISNSTGAGIIGVNMFGLSNISQTVLSGNSPNCLIIFQEDSKLPDIPPTHFNITNTHVMFGKIPQDLENRVNWGATGLGIFLAQTKFNVHIYLTNIKTHSNIRKKRWYGNLRFVIESYECQCSLIQVKQVANTYTGEENDRTQLRLEAINKNNKSADTASCKCSKPAEEENIVQISNSYFEGVDLRIDAPAKYCDIRIKLRNITVHNNVLHILGMRSIEIQDINFSQSTEMVIDDSNITVSGRCCFAHIQNRRVVSLFITYLFMMLNSLEIRCKKILCCLATTLQ